MPTVARNTPMHPPIRFLRTDFEPTLLIMLRPKTVRAKYSGGPKSMAISARKGARNNQTNHAENPADGGS